MQFGVWLENMKALIVKLKSQKTQLLKKSLYKFLKSSILVGLNCKLVYKKIIYLLET